MVEKGLLGFSTSLSVAEAQSMAACMARDKFSDQTESSSRSIGVVPLEEARY